MLSRRSFCLLAAGAAGCGGRKMTSRERIDRILKGEETDRPAVTFWYHFLDTKEPGSRHAELTLSFHRRLGTDLVKVMSDYPYPKPEGGWEGMKVSENPFPEQIRALELIRDGLAGSAHFVETIFNPWNQAAKISSKEELQRLKAEKPQALLDALEIIAKSEANHARKAIQTGASGVFLAVDNAQEGILTREEYRKFSEPFDRMVLDAAEGAPLNVLHLHGPKVYLDLFWSNWPVTVINYSIHETGVGLSDARARFTGVLAGGVDEIKFRTLTREQLTEQWKAARAAVGPKHIVAPGCSIPNESTDEECLRLRAAVGA
jgi:uroporphyrinogen decarboxylase